MELKHILEAAMMAAGRPLDLDAFDSLFEDAEQSPDRASIEQALAEIAEEFEGRPLELKRVASGYRFQVREGYSPWISRLFEERPGRYSRAFLETLAIIAYRQPVTRGEIEDIRGVAVSSGIIKTLLEREWVHIVGHKEVPGRPALLATTRTFLDYFNLTGLADLPPLQDFIQHLDLQPMNESVDTAENSADVAMTALVPAEPLDMVNDENEEN
jgi:segregation and condensation protein B